MTSQQDLLTVLADRSERDLVPMWATLELTHGCDLDCRHCYLDGVRVRPEAMLSTAEWKRILDELAEAGGLFLTLTGGELLARADWLEIAQYARRRAFSLHLMTNATGVDERTADAIKALWPLGVSVSVYGATPNVHNWVTRRPGSFERTLAGVRRLRARDIEVTLKFVMMQANIDQTEAFQGLCSKLGCSASFDPELSPRNNGDRTPTMLAPSRSDVVKALRGIAMRHHTKRMGATEEPSEVRICGAGRRACHIGPQGDLFPCIQWPRPVGSLRARAFRQIWVESPELAAIRALTPKSFSLCGQCALRSVCAPCVALAELETGRLDGPSPTRCASSRARALALDVVDEPPILDRAPEEIPHLLPVRCCGCRVGQESI